ncbi:MAG: ribosome small subunit-dependent GTPase A [Christensenellaceae bacterium]|nr:ribosome small subunit-dependent GTPase A [Christensenellaceae bacterium]
MSQKGVIVKGIGGFYYIDAEDGRQYVVKGKNKLRYADVVPTVGDNVIFYPGEEDQNGWLEDILPRKNRLVRPPVANVELMGIVISPRPRPDYFLVDKLLVEAYRQGIKPLLIYNKCDMKSAVDEPFKAYDKSIECFNVSAVKQIGLDALRERLKTGISCFAGQSGVGKSTLINAILGTELETGKISRKIQRGRHTTRSVELIKKDGIAVLDTPGFSIVSNLDDMQPEELQNYYPEFKAFIGKCKFSPCYHLSEPECAVLNAVEQGIIHKDRMDRYHVLLDEVYQNWRNRYD